MGRAVARPAKTKAERLIDARNALELHLAGVEDTDIAARFGISYSTLRRWYTWALSTVVDPTVQEYRQEAYGRIREQRRRLYAMLTQTTPLLTVDGLPVIDPETGQTVMVPGMGADLRLKAIDRLTRLEELEAKLRGGYAPTQVNVKHTVEDAFDTLLAEINRTIPTTERDQTERQAS